MNTLLIVGATIAFVITIVVFVLSRKEPEPVNPTEKVAAPDRWSMVPGKGHWGDDIENIKGVTVEEAKSQCIKKPGCAGIFFYDLNKTTGKGDAWLKKHAHAPYQDFPSDATYLYS